VAFILLRHANVDDLAAGKAMRDELGAALLPLVDQERVVIGDGLIESQSGLDAVFVQRGQDPEDSNSVPILVVAVATDIWKGWLIAGPQTLRAAHGAHGQRCTGRNLPVPVLKVYDDGEGDAGVVRPFEGMARNDRRPRINVLVHTVASRCRHGSLPLLDTE